MPSLYTNASFHHWRRDVGSRVSRNYVVYRQFYFFHARHESFILPLFPTSYSPIPTPRSSLRPPLPLVHTRVFPISSSPHHSPLAWLSELFIFGTCILYRSTVASCLSAWSEIRLPTQFRTLKYRILKDEVRWWIRWNSSSNVNRQQKIEKRDAENRKKMEMTDGKGGGVRKRDKDEELKEETMKSRGWNFHRLD